MLPGLKITAGQWTMSGQDEDLPGQTTELPVILTGQKFCHFNNTMAVACSQLRRMQCSCYLLLGLAITIFTLLRALETPP